MNAAAVELAARNGRVVAPAVSAETPLVVQGLTVSYGQKAAVFSVDATAPPESMVAIIGPNGAGKSTVLKAVLGIVPRLSGSVTVFGAPFADARHRVAYVPQRASVDWDFPTRVIDVVLMGLYRQLGLLGLVRRAHRETALACLEWVGMGDFADRQIGQLSGGQQQRVFLARALAQDADLYLLDEPFAGVDPIAVSDIQALVRHLTQRGIGVLITDHNVRETLKLIDRAYIIHTGKVLTHGRPNEIIENADVRRLYLGEEFSL